MEYEHRGDGGHQTFRATLVDDGVSKASRRASIARVLGAAATASVRVLIPYLIKKSKLQLSSSRRYTKFS